eukprot:COSAG02_NODE_10246_length_1987_cov_2.292373_1_plen_421_part_10
MPTEEGVSSSDESTHSEGESDVSLGFSADSTSESHAESESGSEATLSSASASESEEDEAEAAHDEQVISISGSYRSLKAGVIRAGVAADSAKIGNLREGEVFEALAAQKVDGGQLRIRMAKGWVSLTAKSGKPLCVAETSVQQLLSTVPLLQHLGDGEKARIADVLEAEEFGPGHPIVVAGELGSVMYFLEQGAAEAEKQGQTVMTYGPGDFFGELALLKDEPRRATVRATGLDGARCLKLGRAAFDDIAIGCAAILEQRQHLYAQSGKEAGEGLAGSASSESLASLVSSVSSNDSTGVEGSSENEIEPEDENDSASVHQHAQPELEPEPEREPEVQPSALELGDSERQPDYKTEISPATHSDRNSTARPKVDTQAKSAPAVTAPSTYMVLASATVRAGPDAVSEKVGEHSKGDIIEVVQE